MAASRVLTKDVLKKFRTVKMLTLPELMLWLDCSQRTAHRRLHDWGAISSYNSNGRYYTLKEVAQFDSNGIWCWQDVRFSRYGNLFETVRGVLDASKGGLTGVEMGEILGMRAHSFLSQFAAKDRLVRERIAGCFVYFSSSPERQAQQKEQRRLQAADAAADKLGNVLAVEILVAMIRDPQATSEEVAKQLQARGIAVKPADIDQVLTHHGLAKKKTSDSPSSMP